MTLRSILKITTTAVALTALTSAAFAESVYNTKTNADDAVQKIEDAVQKDFDRNIDQDRLTSSVRALGWTGTIAATANATGGNSEATNIGIGSRFGYGGRLYSHDFVFAHNFAKDAKKTTVDNSEIAYTITRDLSQNMYVYGNLRAALDDIKTAAYEQDIFAGVGIGYRIQNSSNFSWRIEAGPGYRKLVTPSGVATKNTAASAASKIFYHINDRAFLTNDTSILYSETNTTVVNDLGLTMAVSGPLSMRTSLKTTYNSDPGKTGTVDNKSTDWNAGVSLVYTFN